MLTDTKVINDDGKLVVTINLQLMPCKLVGEGEEDSNHKLSKLTFTGFEKCVFVKPDTANWSQSDIKNYEALDKVKGTTTAYIAEFNDTNNIDTLVIGFPELDGVIFTLKKG